MKKIIAFFCLAITLDVFLCPLYSAGKKAPFKILYINDTTNIEACTAPFHPKGAPFSIEALHGSIGEAVKAGADVCMLSPGFTWVPLWNSTVYPPREHIRWWQETFKRPISSLGKFILEGGDIVREYVDYCKANNTPAFLSIRINDFHHVEDLDAQEGARLHPVSWMAIDCFRRDHPEWRLLATNPAPPRGHKVAGKREFNVLNWAIPQVRERMLMFIRELCENYDLDGLELDCMRYFRLFPDTLSTERRAEIMTSFVGEVRKILDRTASEGKHRWLCVRVSSTLIGQAGVGIDLPRLSKVGLDMANLSQNYYTVQNDLDLVQIRQMNPDLALYQEMNHVTYVGADPNRASSGDSSFYRRTTDEQFYTTAHLGYASGLDGFSLANFAYYREAGNKPERGPFNEPPFHIINNLKNKMFIASQPQHYFLTDCWRTPYGNHVQLPLNMTPGRTLNFNMLMVAPLQGWKKTARLRAQSLKDMGDVQFAVECNGQKLVRSEDISEPYPNPYPPLLGTIKTLRAWDVPPGLLKTGRNKFTIQNLSRSTGVVLFFIDVAVE